MAFTRYHDDTARIQKQLQISTNAGIYQLTAPGQGLDLPYMEDPQIRLQKWGANFDNNIITMESDLRGLTRKYNKDLPDINDHNKHEAAPNAPYFKTQQPLVEAVLVTTRSGGRRGRSSVKRDTALAKLRALIAVGEFTRDGINEMSDGELIYQTGAKRTTAREARTRLLSE
jgi:hypothetical protein